MSALLPSPSLPMPDIRQPHDLEEQRTYWMLAVNSPQFVALLATKARCITPLLALSFVFIISMALLAGYAKGFMGQKIVGAFNVGYLMILLTYVICWITSVVYVLTANTKFDAQSDAAIAALKTRRQA